MSAIGSFSSGGVGAGLCCCGTLVAGEPDLISADLLVGSPGRAGARGALVPVPPSPERKHFPWRGAGVHNKMKNKIINITLKLLVLRVTDSALDR